VSLVTIRPVTMAQDGFLTDTQRDYLRGEHTPPNDNAEQQMRLKIRNRTKKALEDIDLLADGLSQDDIEQTLFDSKPAFEVETWEKAQGRDPDHKSHLDTMAGVIAFFYRGIMSDNRPFYQWYTQWGIKRAYRRQNRVVNDVDIDLEIDLGPKASGIDLDDLSELSQREFWTAVRAGKITPEQIVENREQLSDKVNVTEEVMELISATEKENQD